MWRELHQRLEILPSKLAHKHCRPDDLSLDRFEKEHKLLLPKSYREFSKTFGAGELSGDYRIAVPGYPSLESTWSPNILEINERWHAEDDDDARGNSRGLAFFRSMYYFCETMGGEAIGWSLTECTDRNEAEYRIYMRMRSDSFVPLAESFSQFVLEVCLGDAFDRIMEEHGYAIESPTEVMSVFVAWPCDPNAVGDSNCV